MAARSDEVMPIPVDADTSISETFVSPVECDVLIDLAFVFFHVSLGAVHSRLFLNGEHEKQIPPCLDLRFV